MVMMKPARIRLRCGVPPGEALGGERGRQHADRGGGEDHPGLDGVVVTHDLQVARDNERHAHQDQPLAALGDQAEVGNAVAEQAHRQQWLLARPLLGAHRCEEPHQDQGTGGDQGERQPEVIVGRQDARHQQDEADGGQDRAAGVEGPGRVRWQGIVDPAAQHDDDRDDQCLEDERCPSADR